MRKAEFKKIDGHKYQCRVMKVLDAHDTLLSLLSTVGGPAIKAIAAGADDMEGDAMRLITGAISVAVQNLEGPVSRQLLASVFSGVQYVGDGVDDLGFDIIPGDDNFDDHFGGRLLSMYTVWGWSLQVNYQDFLDGAQALGLGKAKDLGKKALDGLLTST